MSNTGTKNGKFGLEITTKCSRCAGTGDWAPGRVCFQCNGYGYVAKDSAAAAYNRKAAHVAEVRQIIADNEARIVKARWGKDKIQTEIDNRKAQLVTLEAELANMPKG